MKKVNNLKKEDMLNTNEDYFKRIEIINTSYRYHKFHELKIQDSIIGSKIITYKEVIGDNNGNVELVACSLVKKNGAVIKIAEFMHKDWSGKVFDEEIELVKERLDAIGMNLEIYDKKKRVLKEVFIERELLFSERGDIKPKESLNMSVEKALKKLDIDKAKKALLIQFLLKKAEFGIIPELISVKSTPFAELVAFVKLRDGKVEKDCFLQVESSGRISGKESVFRNEKGEERLNIIKDFNLLKSTKPFKIQIESEDNPNGTLKKFFSFSLTSQNINIGTSK